MVLPVPSNTRKAIPQRKLLSYFVVLLVHDDSDVAELLLSTLATLSRFITYKMN